MDRRPYRWRIGLLITSTVCLASAATAVEVKPPFPVVPGYHVLKDSGKVDAAMQGELLLGELNCVSCHAAGEGSRLVSRGAPDLSDVGQRVTPQYLTQFLLDPDATKPGTTMPDLFHASAGGPKAGAVEALVHFLVSQGGPMTDLAAAGTPALAERGKQIYETVGCAACHEPANGAATKVPSVPLGKLAEKTSLDALAAFLLDPMHARPSGRMPSLSLSPSEARAIATYLLRDQLKSAGATTQPMPGTGVRYELFDATLTTAKPQAFDDLQPKSRGKVKSFTVNIPGIKERSHYAVRFSTSLWIARGGRYTFGLKSDDGAILSIDGNVVADNDGIHPANKEKSGHVDLKAGMHAAVLTYFQNGGGDALEVLWQGPGIPHQELPPDVLAVEGAPAMQPPNIDAFTVDPDKAQLGGQMFAILGCASCHNLPGHASMKRAKPLDQLNVDAPDGCLGEQITKGRPKYDLSPDQRSVIAAALKDVADFNKPLGPAKQAIREMAAMNCLACHQRDKIGGVPGDRNELFKSEPGVDLGDEGRLPPRLTGVGSKLLPAAIERVVFRGELRIRPYVQTRMPVFKQDVLKDLPDTLAKADAKLDAPSDSVPHTSPAAVHDGWRLVGIKGLGCVNCHGAKGAKSLGVPAPDFSLVRDRLRPQWFRRLLGDPNVVNPGTRMPSFWPEGQSPLPNLAGGTFEGQAAAIWSYLQQDPEEMQLPEGLKLKDSDELVPADEVIVQRAFVTGVGPRAILVGNPEGLHWVFDANEVRLAKAWHGKFFDAAGIWESRGGTARPPLGKDVTDLPTGPSFAVLDSQAAPWPQPRPGDLFDRNLGGSFKGYALDKQGRPTFHYVLHDVDVRESEVPKGTGKDAALERRFALTTKADVKDFYFLVATGKKIESTGPNSWLVDGKLKFRLSAGEGGALPATEIRDRDDGIKELILPVTFTTGHADFAVEMSW